MDNTNTISAHVGEIVSAYVSNNSVPQAELPLVIAAVHRALKQIEHPEPVAEAASAQEPAVSIKKSVHPDYVVCLDCGTKYKSLKRHLSSGHGLTPDEYRTKWALPHNYTMVASNYAATRSQLAKDSGLGQIGSGRTASSDLVVEKKARVKAATKKAAAAGTARA